ncbi:cytochrome P450 family protein [Streptomyces adustus]|uniref:cytochrome P450 family protein n=1 Tax=Streptomyces adustus TaxID=1609272 RepID=UPI00372445E3
MPTTPRDLLAGPPQQLLDRRVADPYPYFAWLRRHAPVSAERKTNGMTVWQIARYTDVDALIADGRLSKRPERVPGYVAGPPGLNRHLVHSDPPDHTRLRALVNTAFIPRRVTALEPVVRTAATQLLDRLEGRRRVELIGDFAGPLTFAVICRILGVPPAMDTPELREVLLATVMPTGTHATAAGRERTGRDLYAFLAELVAHKRAAGPSATAETDLVGALVHARDHGDTLTEEELLSTAYLLLLVGHDTTLNLIGNGTLALLQHPDQAKQLDAEPDLIGLAVEELLRFDAPVRDATFRVTAEPVEAGGHTIPPGDVVSLLIGSANRDPERFDQPDVLDLARTPNEHLSFGRGPHFCIGAALARLEARIAFPLLLERLGQVRLAIPAESLTWRPTRVMRGLAALPLERY